MESGYKIVWTSNALKELRQTIQYLEDNFSAKEIRKLALKIEFIIELIAKNPKLFAKSEYKQVYRVPVLKFNTMYYRIHSKEIHILSFFSNRQTPQRRKI